MGESSRSEVRGFLNFEPSTSDRTFLARLARRASLTNTSGAGGGFKQMVVDINHTYVRHWPIKTPLCREIQTVSYDHAGTRIAPQAVQEHVSRS